MTYTPPTDRGPSRLHSDPVVFSASGTVAEAAARSAAVAPPLLPHQHAEWPRWQLHVQFTAGVKTASVIFNYKRGTKWYKLPQFDLVDAVTVDQGHFIEMTAPAECSLVGMEVPAVGDGSTAFNVELVGTT